jgi:hypothetical protein
MSGLEAILSKATDLGFRPHQVTLPSDLFTPSTSTDTEGVINPSLLVDIVDDLIAIHNEHMQLEYSVAELKLFSMTADYTQPQRLQMRMSALQDLVDHISLILERKSTLINRLQSPITDDVLPIEWEHREHFIALIQEIGAFQDRYREIMDDLQSFKTFDFPTQDTTARLQTIKESLVQMQQYHEQILCVRSLVEDMHALRCVRP